MNASEVDDLNLQAIVVETRQRYSRAIHDLAVLISREKIKKIEIDNLVKIPPSLDTTELVILNVDITNPTVSDEKNVPDIINKLKQQTVVMNIVRKNVNCPIAQIMDNL